jgi:hypothetical protein
LPVRANVARLVCAFFDGSYSALGGASPPIRTVTVMDELPDPTTTHAMAARTDGRRPRRKPRAARARKAATVMSVATMLSLGGVLAWRDGVATTASTQTAAAATKTSNSSTNTSRGTSTSSSSTQSTTSHTTTSGS